jgi:hypothetical protein
MKRTVQHASRQAQDRQKDTIEFKRGAVFTQFAAMRNASELSLAPGFPRKIDSVSASIVVPMRTPSVALVHICSSIREGAENAFCEHLNAENDQFAQTGSGRSPRQARERNTGNVEEKSVFSAGASTTTPTLHKTTTPGTTIVRWSELLPDSGRCVAKYIVQQGPEPQGHSPACCNASDWADGFKPVNDPDPMGFGGGTIFNGYIHADDAGGCAGCCYRVLSRDYWGAISPPSNVTCPEPAQRA